MFCVIIMCFRWKAATSVFFYNTHIFNMPTRIMDGQNNYFISHIFYCMIKNSLFSYGCFVYDGYGYCVTVYRDRVSVGLCGYRTFLRALENQNQLCLCHYFTLIYKNTTETEYSVRTMFYCNAAESSNPTILCSQQSVESNLLRKMECFFLAYRIEI